MIARPQLGFDFGPTNADVRQGFKSKAAFEGAVARAFGASGQGRTAKDAIRLALVETAVGQLIAGSRDGALVLLEFASPERLTAQARMLRQYFDPAFAIGEDATLRQTRRELDEYFAGKRRNFEVPLAFPGTPFEESVWRALLKIPYGETTSYEAIALEVATKEATRAVGTANGRNRIAIIIPCHRVVNKSGKLGGYGGGLWRKETLLGLEQGRKFG